MVKDNRQSRRDQVDSREARIMQAIYPDIATIAELGDVDAFADFLYREVPDAWRDQADSPYRIQWDATEEAAVKLLAPAIDPDIIRAECRWRRNRPRLLKRAKLIREYAEQLRKGAR